MADADCPQNQPYVMQVEPGTYAWCACGKSADQPYCDGSHAGTEFRPVVETVVAADTIAWCGCKRTGSPPRCDGSHARL